MQGSTNLKDLTSRAPIQHYARAAFMEDTYLVEIRLASTKWRIREIISGIAGTFHLEPFMERHPHITLFGPLVLNPGITSDNLLETIGSVARGFGPLPFMINGWEMRRGMHGSVIAFPVTPSEPLKDLTRSLAGSLVPITGSLNAWDSRPDAKWFHITVVNRLNPEQAASCFSRLTCPGTGNPSPGPGTAGFAAHLFARIRKFLHGDVSARFPPQILDGTGLRITVLHNEEILAEYDLLGKEWIYGDHSHDSSSWQETLRRYRRAAGFEREAPRPPDPGDIFLIADMHLGHANIIRYCSRPFVFGDCPEMDRVLVRNWNYVVGESAPVYHLGDLQYGKGAPPVHEYLEQLGGRATFITGNHDLPAHGWVKSADIRHNGFHFFLVHDPAETPPDFDGWVIHGHHHNNELKDFPFMDFANRHINVSAEVIGYVPIGLLELESRMREHTDGKTRGPVLLRYPYTPPGERSAPPRLQ